MNSFLNTSDTIIHIIISSLIIQILTSMYWSYLIQYDMGVFQHVFLADQFPQQDPSSDKQNPSVFWGLLVHSNL